MTYIEFEGRTEREAVARAAAELGSESFDVEVLEKSNKLFGRGKVKIRVKPLTSIPNPLDSGDSSQKRKRKNRVIEEDFDPSSMAEEPEEIIEAPPKEILRKIGTFVEEILDKMGTPGTTSYKEMNGVKVVFDIKSDFSGIIIGKKGKNIDALQLLVNVYLIRIVPEQTSWRIVLDAENYRSKQKEALINLANRVADEAVRRRASRLLEPMNPFERRLVHTTINQRTDAFSKSEGEGLYKRVRIVAKNRSQGRNRR